LGDSLCRVNRTQCLWWWRPTSPVTADGRSAFKGTVDEYGPALVDILEALPDHTRLLQEHLVRHEGVKSTGMAVKHREMRVAEECEEFRVRVRRWGRYSSSGRSLVG
jgi:hypothetical protein